MTMVPSHTIRETLARALDNLALNHAQQLACFNPDREINSLGERLASLRAYGVPEQVITALFGDLKRVMELNAREGANTRQTAGELDQLATVIADSERNGARQIMAAESIKQIACELRPHLAVLRAPQKHDGTAWSVAYAAVQDVIRRTPRSRLLSPTMHHQLRDGPFEQLVALIDRKAVA